MSFHKYIPVYTGLSLIFPLTIP